MSNISISRAERALLRLLELAIVSAALPLVVLGAPACVGAESEPGPAATAPALRATREAPVAAQAVIRIDHSVMEALPVDPSGADPTNPCGS